MMYQGAIGKFDINAQKVETFSLPPEMNKDMAQVNMVRPESAAVDGKVWSQNNGFAAIHRLDLKTGADRDHRAVRGRQAGENHNIYDIVPDSKNNVYFTDFAQQHIGRRRRQDRPDHAVRAADQGVGAAARHDGCAGPHVVRRISRQQDRDVRHQGPKSSRNGKCRRRSRRPTT